MQQQTIVKILRSEETVWVAGNTIVGEYEGTGFVICKWGKAYVITNEHVIRKAQKDNWIVWGAFRAPINSKPLWLEYINSVHDIAILNTGLTAEDMVDDDLSKIAYEGMKVYTYGFDENSFWNAEPDLQEWIIETILPYVRSERILISSWIYPWETTKALMIRGINSTPWRSGSPLFAEDWMIVGYLHASNDDGRALAISIEHAYKIISQMK